MKGRQLNKPADYILDQDHHHHFGKSGPKTSVISSLEVFSWESEKIRIQTKVIGICKYFGNHSILCKGLKHYLYDFNCRFL
jgi:hypothetical protein